MRSQRVATPLERVFRRLGAAGLGADPRFRLHEQRPHLGEERAGRSPPAFQRLDPLQPSHDRTGLVHDDRS